MARCELEVGEAVPPYKIGLPDGEISGTADPVDAGDGHPRMGSVLLSGFDTADRPANVWLGSLVDEIPSLAYDLSEAFM